MNCKNMVTTFTTLLIGLMLSGTAWAEKPAKHPPEKPSSSCRITSGIMLANLNDTEDFGDLKIRVNAVHLADSTSDKEPNYIVFDVKAPNYIKRNIRLGGGRNGDPRDPQKFADTICDTEVTISYGGVLKVSTF